MDHRNLYDVIVHIAHSRSALPAIAAQASRTRHDSNTNDSNTNDSNTNDSNTNDSSIDESKDAKSKDAETPEAPITLDEFDVSPAIPDPTPSKWRRELHWGTDEFNAASDLARRMVGKRRITALAKALLRREPRRALAATYRAPVAVARLRATDERQLHAFLPPAGRPVFAGTRAQAVLDVPLSPYTYLAGKHRQAVRTNIRHAAKRAITCERSAGYRDWLESAEAVLHARDGGAEALATMGPPVDGERVLLYAAKDAEGTPVAVAGIVMYGDLAYLFTLLSNPNHKASASVRYILHTFAALDLGQEGGLHLVVGSALREREGNQYFQHLLGYRVRNLRLDVS